MTAASNKFNQQVEQIEKVKKILVDAVSDAKLFEMRIKPQVDQVLKIRDIICLTANVFVDDVLDNAMKKIAGIVKYTHHDIFLEELMGFLNEYASHDRQLISLQKNKAQLAKLITEKSNLWITICQRFEEIKGFWFHCVAIMQSAVGNYEIVAKQLLPVINLKQTIKDHWALLLIGGLLLAGAAATVGVFVLMSPLYLALLIAGGAVAGACLGFSAGLILDCFSPVKLPPLSPEEISSLLGPLPNQPQTQFKSLALAPNLKAPALPSTAASDRKSPSKAPAPQSSKTPSQASAISSLKC